MKGKNRCKILKDIRRRIAEENGIAYVTEECKYKGDCSGTCPKCESEVRYLERELERKRSLGYKVTVVGLAAGITLSATGCTPDTTSRVSSGQSLDGDLVVESSEYAQSGSDTTSENVSSEYVSEVETFGYLAPDFSDEYSEEAIAGALPLESEDISDETEADDLTGDIAIP